MDVLREFKQQIEILLEDLMDSDQINEKWEISAKWGDKLSEESFKQDPQKMIDIANKHL